MKQGIICALIAAVVAVSVSIGVGGRSAGEVGDSQSGNAPNIDQLADRLAGDEDFANRFRTIALSFTEEQAEDAWVDGARSTGTDERSLADPANSICFLTDITIQGIQGPEDANACRIVIDDFTGFWRLDAVVEEGGMSHVRCNARCLVWE